MNNLTLTIQFLHLGVIDESLPPDFNQCLLERKFHPTADSSVTPTLRGTPSLPVRPNHTQANRLALTFRNLEPRLLRLFLRLKRLRQRREFTIDVPEQQPLFNDFRHRIL